MFSKKEKYLFSTILLLAAFLKFFHLSWGNGYFFHPDENNIARSVINISRSSKLDPQFYAYGQLPAYLTFFTLSFLSYPVDFSRSILGLRFYSALANLLIVLVAIFFSKRIFKFKKPFLFLPPLFVAFTPALIQAAHFGTPASFLTLFFLLSLYFSNRFLLTKKSNFLILAAFFSGLAAGIKISGLIFLFCPLFALLLHLTESPLSFSKFKKVAPLLFAIIAAFIIAALLAAPYLAFPKKSWPTLKYETEIARGKIPIFYTRQFINTTPYLFQARKIFPYALGWPLFITGSLGFLLMFLYFFPLKKIRKKKAKIYLLVFLSTAFYFLYFGQVFVKWTRFMVPIMPLFSFGSTIFLEKASLFLKQKKFSPFLIRLFIIVNSLAIIFPGQRFFGAVYSKEDIRLTASKWMKKNLKKQAVILSEAGNVVNLPVGTNPSFRIINFDFYCLDQDPDALPHLSQSFAQADYILVPSRRVYANHLRLKKDFPLTAAYYELLFSGQLGTKIKEFSCLPDEKAEETWSVFDHPKIMIYEKKLFLSPQKFQKLIKEKANLLY